jgi:DNA-directed RNA polymerase subunit RPC12/RpoP
VRFKIKFVCAYCAEILPGECEMISNGSFLCCPRCGKTSLVNIEKADEHAKRVTMGQYYNDESKELP